MGNSLRLDDQRRPWKRSEDGDRILDEAKKAAELRLLKQEEEILRQEALSGGFRHRRAEHKTLEQFEMEVRCSPCCL